MLYPETSPSAPVSRDDLAQILALQEMQAQGLAGGQQAGDANSMSMASAMDALTGGVPGYGEGAPAPGSASPGGRGGVSDTASFAPGGALTTANASMVGDPLGESGPVGVPGYARSGDDTSQQSQDKQAADRAAITEAVTNQGMVPQGNPLEDAAQAYGSTFGRSFEGFNAPTTPSTYGSSTFAQPGATPVSTTTFAAPTAPTAPTAPAVPGYQPGGPWDPDMPQGVPVTPTPTTTPTPNAPPPGAPPDAPPSTPGLPSGFDMGSPAPGGSDFGPGAYGGFTSGSGNTAGFGAGYSGSADMGNTQGATGFTSGDPSGMGGMGGGAVGGFGGGSSAGDNSSDGGGQGGSDPGGAGDTGSGGVG